MPFWSKAVFTQCKLSTVFSSWYTIDLIATSHVAEIYSFLSLAGSVEFRITVRQSSFYNQFGYGAADANVIADVFQRVFAQAVQQGQRGDLGDVLWGGVRTAV